MAWILVLVMVLVGALAVGLWLSKNASNKQEDALKTKARVRKMRQLAVDIEEMLDTLKKYDGDTDLQVSILSYLISDTEKRLQLDPSNEETKTDLLRLKDAHSKAEGSSGGRASIPHNDRQLAIMRRHLSKTIKLIRHMLNKGFISETDAQEHVHRLKLLALNSEVEAYLVQGDRCRENDDNLTAASYYKHAKETLLSSSIQFDGKTKEIKRISKLISGIYSSNPNEDDDYLPEDSPMEDGGLGSKSGRID